jgi:hypothetical protein
MLVLIADKFEQSGRDDLQGLGCEVSFQPDQKDDALKLSPGISPTCWSCVGRRSLNRCWPRDL